MKDYQDKAFCGRYLPWWYCMIVASLYLSFINQHSVWFSVIGNSSISLKQSFSDIMLYEIQVP